MVVKDRPVASPAETWQERRAFPFSRMVQAPQTPTPQPNFVPVSPNESRSTQSNGVSGSTSSSRSWPLTVR